MKKLFTIVFLLLFSAGLTRSYAQGVMTTWVGDTAHGYSGDGGAAAAARLNGPYNVAFDGERNLYITDMYNNAVRRVDAHSGFITTIAGGDSAGYSGDGGPAASARLNMPADMCVDADGNIYFSDSRNFVIRKISATTHTISTIAGNGTLGYSGDGGPATAAMIAGGGMCLDAGGHNLYFADAINNRIRKVNLGTGMISTFAGSDSGYSGDGGAASAAKFNEPTAICIDPHGNFYVADHNNYVIRKIAAGTGIVTTIAGNGTNGFGGDGGPALGATIGSIYGLCCDQHGDVYINDWSCSCRKIRCSTDGKIVRQAGDAIYSGYNGDGGPALAEWLSCPVGVCVDPATGDIVIADLVNNSIRRATQPGYISLLGIGAVQISPAVSVFPNPSAGLITVAATAPMNARITVTNITGAEVYATRLIGTQASIDISSQPAGLYFINVISATGVETRKILVR